MKLEPQMSDLKIRTFSKLQELKAAINESRKHGYYAKSSKWIDGGGSKRISFGLTSHYSNSFSTTSAVRVEARSLGIPAV
jgi:hypothetical protein